MNKSRVPDCKLEWYLLGTLSEQEHAEIAALERSDEELRARIDALRASDAEILADYPPPRLAKRLKQWYPRARAAAVTHIHLGSPRWAASVFICAALLFILPMLIITAPALIDTLEADETSGEISPVTVPDTVNLEENDTEEPAAKDTIHINTLISD